MQVRKKRRDGLPWGSRLIVWGGRWAEQGSAPLHVALRNRKGGGLHGNSPLSLETGELYHFTRQYCFFTTNGFLAPPVYLSRIDSACQQRPYNRIPNQILIPSKYIWTHTVQIWFIYASYRVNRRYFSTKSPETSILKVVSISFLSILFCCYFHET